jgi:hypothetical protein
MDRGYRPGSSVGTAHGLVVQEVLGSILGPVTKFFLSFLG